MTLKRLLRIQGELILTAVALLLFAAGLNRAIEDGIQGIITLFLLLISLFVPVLFCFIRRADEKKLSTIDLFQPGIIVAIFFFIYIWVPAFRQWYFLDYSPSWVYFSGYQKSELFNYTLGLVNAGMLVFGVGYKNTFRYLLKSSILNAATSKLEIGKWKNDIPVRLIIIGLIIVGLIANISAFSRLGGISHDLLMYLSPSMFFQSGIKMPGAIDFLTSFLTWGALFLVFTSVITQKNKTLSFTILLLVFIAQFFIFVGKRSYVAPILILPFLWHHYLRGQITPSRGIIYILGGFILMACLLLFRIFVSLSTAGGDTYTIAASMILRDPIDFFFNTPELSLYEMTMLCMNEHHEILEAIGGWIDGFYKYNISPILYVVPRFTWPDKPVFQDIGQVLYGSFIGRAEYAGFSTGIFGVLYIFGGIPGLLTGMFVLGIVCKIVYSKFRPYEGNPSLVFGYSVTIWILFMFLRFGSIGFTLLFIIQRLFAGVLVSAFLLRRFKQYRKRHYVLK